MSALEQIITKARGEELTSSEIVDCLRGIADMNSQGSSPRLETYRDGTARLFLSRYMRAPEYGAKTVEDALIAAYDDLSRMIAEGARA